MMALAKASQLLPTARTFEALNWVLTLIQNFWAAVMLG